MFSLIISIIAIALVAALAGASVYYGGSAFNKGTSDATYAKMTTQADQINGAIVMFKALGNSFDTTICGSTGGNDASANSARAKDCLQQLVTAKFLTSIPEGSDGAVSGWSMDDSGSLYTSTSDKKACIKANEQAGYFVVTGDPTVDPDSDSVPALGTADAICTESA